MNVNFEYYKIFYYVAKYHNFTKAARALCNSQPNVTRAMNCLEHELNCTLFVRTNRGVRSGTRKESGYIPGYLWQCQQLQTAEERVLSESVGLEHGSVSIGASETALNIYLLDRLHKFHLEYPGVRLKLCNDSTPEAIRSVRSGEIDFAVVTTPVKVEVPLKEIRLRSFQEILVGGKTFTALASQELSLKDLKDYPLISLGRETTTYHFCEKLFLEHGAELVPDTEAATTDQVLPLVKNELGLAFLPEGMAEEALKKHEIIQMDLKEGIPSRHVCMIYDAKRPMSAAAQKLKKLLQEEKMAMNMNKPITYLVGKIKAKAHSS